MCVIVIAEKSRPTAEVIEKCWTANPYGGGASWLAGKQVFYKKGLDKQEMLKFAAVLPKPFILHFRIPTAGGDVEALTHPFPLGGDLSLVGSTRHGVLFHNGHWTDWAIVMATLRATLGGGWPKGPWSDSRVMAFISRHGTEWLDELYGQRICVQTPKGIERFGTWTESTKDSGLWYSNESWRNSFRGYHDRSFYDDLPAWNIRRGVGTGCRITYPSGSSVHTSGETVKTIGPTPLGSTPPLPKTTEMMVTNTVIRESHNPATGEEVVWIKSAQITPDKVFLWQRWIRKPDGKLILDNPKDFEKGLSPEQLQNLLPNGSPLPDAMTTLVGAATKLLPPAPLGKEAVVSGVSDK